MSGESYCEISTRYKDSKQPNIEESRFRYRKKKFKQKIKKSNHKHTYAPAIFYSDGKIGYDSIGEYCIQCGKIHINQIAWNKDVLNRYLDEGAKEFFNIDIYKDKIVEI